VRVTDGGVLALVVVINMDDVERSVSTLLHSFVHLERYIVNEIEQEYVALHNILFEIQEASEKLKQLSLKKNKL